MAVNSNVLFFYNATAGTGATALLDEFGNYVYKDLVGGGLPKRASLITGAKNGSLFFLKTSNSTGAVWFINELGEARPVQGLNGFGVWSKITSG